MKLREKIMTVLIGIFVFLILLHKGNHRRSLVTRGLPEGGEPEEGGEDLSMNMIAIKDGASPMNISNEVVIPSNRLKTTKAVVVVDTAKEKWEMTQKIRREALRQACNPKDRETNIAETVKHRDLLWHHLVDNNHHALYCYIPKVACTNWKRLMLILSGTVDTTNPLEIKHGFTHVEFGKIIITNKKQHNHTNEELAEKLRTYKKFIVVRHPFERILSAYRDKLEDSKKRNSFYWKIGHQMAIVIRGKPDLKYEDFDGLKFPEFIEFIVTQKTNDEHWKPYWNLCFPCTNDFDYIAKYETVNEDSEYILRAIGAPDYLHFPAADASKTGSKLDEYLKQLEPGLLLQLYQKYKKDFEMFGYHL